MGLFSGPVEREGRFLPSLTCKIRGHIWHESHRSTRDGVIVKQVFECVHCGKVEVKK